MEYSFDINSETEKFKMYICRQSTQGLLYCLSIKNAKVAIKKTKAFCNKQIAFLLAIHIRSS